MEALFLQHEGYFGALGTFLYSAFGEETERIMAETQQQQEKAKKTKLPSPEKSEKKRSSFSPIRLRNFLGGNKDGDSEEGEIQRESSASNPARRPRSSSDDAFLRFSNSRKL